MMGRVVVMVLCVLVRACALEGTPSSASVDTLVEKYLGGWTSKPQALNESALTLLVQTAEKCHELQRVIMSEGKAHFLQDSLCAQQRQQQREKGKAKFVVLTQRHMARVAQSCGSSIKFVDFVVNLRDEPAQKAQQGEHPGRTGGTGTGSDSGTHAAPPLFSFQTRRGYLDVPIEYSVDAYNDALHEFVTNVTRQVAGDPASFAWDKRVPKLFWRGSQTGGMYGLDNWESFPRSKLVLLSQQRPALIDAGFTAWTQVFPRARKRMVQVLGRLSEFVDMGEHWRFKYLASLDGNGWANRLPFLLATGSLVFKQESEFSAWWYPYLKAWEHYVPLPADMNAAGVEEALAWAAAHDQEARRMARAGQQLVSSLLQDESVHNHYMCALLGQYQDIQSPGLTSQAGRDLTQMLVRKYGSRQPLGA